MVALERMNVEDAVLQSYNNFLVTDGNHKAVILSSSMEKAYVQGSPDDLVFKGVITEGQHEGAEFEVRCGIFNDSPINSNNPNFTWKIAGYNMIGQMAKAIGLSQIPSDSSDFNNKPIVIETKTKKGTPYEKDGQTRQGNDKSLIKAIHPASASTVQPVQQQQSHEPVQQQPVQQQESSNPFG